jgi:N-acetylmuramoyl-L-alanine amidase
MVRLMRKEARGRSRKSGIVTAALLVAAAGIGPEALAQAPQSEADVDEELRCLALAMYFEARNEGPEGMRAVGWVVLNRIANDEFPGTACDVVREGGETPPCQFSWWCDGKSDAPTDTDQWQTALAVATKILDDPDQDPTKGALFFHSANIEVPWVIERTKTAEFLGHVYYR